MKYNGKTVVTKENLRVGASVIRGPDWKWDNQDRNGVGVVVKYDDATDSNTYWTRVRWSNGYEYSYRIGLVNHDLCYVEDDIQLNYLIL